LITGWGYCGTNSRHTLFDAHLLVGAPHGHPGCRLYLRASQDFTRAGPEILGARGETIYEGSFTSLSVKSCAYIVLYKHIIEANKYILSLFSMHRVLSCCILALGQIYLDGRLIKVFKLNIIIKHRVEVGPQYFRGPGRPPSLPRLRASPRFDIRIIPAYATYIDIQHTEIYSQIVNLHTSPIEITHSIIFINQILHKVFHCFDHKVYQLTITQRLTIM
jgi:hypothetical protein